MSIFEIKNKKMFAEGFLDNLELFLDKYKKDLPEPAFNEDSIRLLEKRYLLKDGESGLVFETLKEFVARIAVAIAFQKKYEDEERFSRALKYYKIIASLDFLPNSPTLMNAGLKNGQLSACFVLKVDDSIEGIYKALKDVALVHQSGGGTGMDFSRLRPEGDTVKSTAGTASGPVSFMKVFDASTEQIKQGGKRRGANMGVLSVHHPDIMSFITCKDDGVSLQNFNISVAVTESFMKAVEQDTEYELIHPNSKKVIKYISAREVWNKMVEHAHKNGDPGIIFIDEVNKHNPIRGEEHRITATNPCVVPETWVMTKNGPRQVHELLNSPQDVYVDGISYSSTNFFETGIKDIYRLKTKQGWTMDLTKDHKIMTKNRGWIEAQNLTIEDKIKLHNHQNIEWDGEGTEDEGYLLGLLLGDGYIKNEKEGALICVWGEPENLINKVKELMNSNGTFLSESNSRRFKSKKLWLLAEKFNMLNKIINPEIEKASSDFYKGFLRGFFDADGHIEGDVRHGISVRLSQSDYHNITSVQRMLSRLGIVSSIGSPRSAQWKNMPAGKDKSKEYYTKEQYRLYFYGNNINIFNEKIGFLEDNKKRKIEEKMALRSKRVKKVNFYADFKSLEYIRTDKVYDITVDKVHAFDGNGLYLSNCGEEPLESYEACNLGSINLTNFIDINGKIDSNRLKDIIILSTEFLNDTIDSNVFPLKEIEDKVHENRKIGLGLMGFADILIAQEIAYGSKQSLRIAKQVMKMINDIAVKTSHDIAEKEGVFPNWEISTWKDTPYTVRNANMTTIAPTGTISMIANTVSSGMEPLFALAYVKNVMDGEKFYFVHPAVERLYQDKEITKEDYDFIKEHGKLPDRLLEDYPYLITASQITPKNHVLMQAAFQQHVHAAVSKTINMPKTATIEDVDEAYKLAYLEGCKGITIYRDGSKEGQILTTASASKKEETKDIEKTITAPRKKIRPESLDGKTIKIKTGCGSLYVTISVDENGTPLEIFCRLGKSGGCASSNMEVYGRLISGWLRAGMPVEDLVMQLRGISCSNPAFVPGGRVLSCADAVGVALERYLNGQFGVIKQDEETDGIEENPVSEVSFTKIALRAGGCPECGGPMEYEGGCSVCKACGYSKCA